MTENTSYPRPTGTFWALDTEHLAEQAKGRFVDYLRGLERRGLQDLYDRTADVYYGFDPSTQSLSDWIREGGEQGEFLHLHVNEMGSLLKHQLILTTSDQMALTSRGTNDSPEAEAQAALADQVITFYLEEDGLDARLAECCEYMLRQGIGYVVQTWDAHAGQDARLEEEAPAQAMPMDMNAPAPPSGMQEPPMAAMSPAGPPMPPPPPPSEPSPTIAKTGDVLHRVYGPQDVAIDLGCRSHTDVRWYIVRERWDRWTAAARFPEAAADIIDRPAYNADEYTAAERKTGDTETRTTTDQINMLRVLVDRCDAVPEGLEALVCGTRVLLGPLPLPYKRLPVHPMYAEEIKGTPLGYSLNWSLLGPQAALNACVSNGVTSMDAGSVPKWAIARGSNTKVEDLGPNARAVYYDANPQMPDGGLPRLMQTPELRDSHIKGEELARARLERLSGINAVVRGQSEGKSGADNALLDAKATQYMGPYSKAYARTTRSVALGLVECLQVFADRDRMIGIVGEDEAPSLEFFSGDDIAEIRKIEVELGDPAMRSPQGRMAIADKLAERYPDKIDAEQYIAFVSGGRLEPLLKAPRNSIRLIKGENAQLSKGVPQPVAKSDQHACHISEHLAILSTPAVRRDPAIMQAVFNHVNEHYSKWLQISMEEPYILLATGQQPAPAPMTMGGPGAPPGGPQPGAPPPPGGGPPPPTDAPGSAPNGAAPQGAPQELGAGGVAMPSMPKNAATGEQAPPAPNGGMS